jgi:hypothetical protein
LAAHDAFPFALFSGKRRFKAAPLRAEPITGAHLAAESIASDRSDAMIRKLASGEYRLYSRKVNPKTGRRRNLGTFKTRSAAELHEREVQYFKRHA